MTFTTVLFFLLQVHASFVIKPDSAEARVQFEEAMEVNDTLAMAQAWYKQGLICEEAGDPVKSNEALQQALVLATRAKNYSMMGKAMNFIAINLGEMGKRDESVAMSWRAFENLMLAGDSAPAANVKINMGMDYVNQGDYEEALKLELEALDLRLACGDSTNLAAYYQRIGEVYKELGIREKWKSSLETAHRLSANPRYAGFNTRIGILNDFGGIYEAEKQFERAVEVYTEMYKLSKEEGYLNGMATALTNLSPVYRNMGMNDKALDCAKEGLSIREKRGNVYGQICSCNQLGEVYLDLGAIGISRDHFLRALKLSVQNEYVAEQKVALEGLYRVARVQKQWKDALTYHEQWSELEDSLQNIDLQKKLTELEMRFQTEKKEQQIEQLNQENELKNARLKFQKLAIWTGSLFILTAAMLAFFLVRQKRRQQVQRQNELEQKLLRSQMNPHFIFNSLGAIQNFMMKNEGRKAAFYLGSFSSLMRSILTNSREELIPLREEKQTLENYLRLQQLRLGEKLSFTVDVAGELDTEEILLPPMLIQPFVENAIGHGIENREGAGRVSVRFSENGDQLVVTVEDNGAGISQTNDKKESHVSYALQIFQERVANLKRMYGTGISYRIEEKDPGATVNPGTRVTVYLPLNNK